MSQDRCSPENISFWYQHTKCKICSLLHLVKQIFVRDSWPATYWPPTAQTKTQAPVLSLIGRKPRDTRLVVESSVALTEKGPAIFKMDWREVCLETIIIIISLSVAHSGASPKLVFFLVLSMCVKYFYS